MNLPKKILSSLWTVCAILGVLLETSTSVFGFRFPTFISLYSGNKVSCNKVTGSCNKVTGFCCRITTLYNHNIGGSGSNHNNNNNGNGKSGNLNGDNSEEDEEHNPSDNALLAASIFSTWRMPFSGDDRDAQEVSQTTSSGQSANTNRPSNSGRSTSGSNQEEESESETEDEAEQPKFIVLDVVVNGTQVLPKEILSNASMASGLLGSQFDTKKLHTCIYLLNKWYMDNGYIFTGVTGASSFGNGAIMLQVTEPILSDTTPLNLLFYYRKNSTDETSAFEPSPNNKGKTRPSTIVKALGLKKGHPVKIDRNKFVSLQRSPLYYFLGFTDGRISQENKATIQIALAERNTIVLEPAITKTLLDSKWAGELSFEDKNVLGMNYVVGLHATRALGAKRSSFKLKLGNDKFGRAGAWTASLFRDNVDTNMLGDESIRSTGHSNIGEGLSKDFQTLLKTVKTLGKQPRSLEPKNETPPKINKKLAQKTEKNHPKTDKVTPSQQDISIQEKKEDPVGAVNIQAHDVNLQGESDTPPPKVEDNLQLPGPIVHNENDNVNTDTESKSAEIGGESPPVQSSTSSSAPGVQHTGSVGESPTRSGFSLETFWPLGRWSSCVGTTYQEISSTHHAGGTDDHKGLMSNIHTHDVPEELITLNGDIQRSAVIRNWFGQKWFSGSSEESSQESSQESSSPLFLSALFKFKSGIFLDGWSLTDPFTQLGMTLTQRLPVRNDGTVLAFKQKALHSSESTPRHQGIPLGGQQTVRGQEEGAYGMARDCVIGTIEVRHPVPGKVPLEAFAFFDFAATRNNFLGTEGSGRTFQTPPTSTSTSISGVSPMPSPGIHPPTPPPPAQSVQRRGLFGLKNFRGGAEESSSSTSTSSSSAERSGNFLHGFGIGVRIAGALKIDVGIGTDGVQRIHIGACEPNF